MSNNEQISYKEQCAIYLLSKGLTIIPLHGVIGGFCTCGNTSCHSQGKHPMYKDWQNTGHLKSNKELRQFWHDHPNGNYGILTKGMVVIDVDERNGGVQNYEMYIKPIIGDVETFCVKTGSGGDSKHICFNDPTGELKCKTGVFKGIDVKASGGFIVGVGSAHISGNNYEIINWGFKGGFKIANLPDKLRELIYTQSKITSSKNEIKANLLFEGEICEGERNTALTSYAGSLLHKGLKSEEIKNLLLAKNLTFCPPLEDQEVSSVFKSISRYSAAESLDWEAPNFNYSVKEFSFKDVPISLIPEHFKDYVLKKHNAIGVPISAIMVSMLTVISAVLGAAFKIKQSPKTDYVETLNLWGMIVAPPSSRKTSVLNILKTALDSIDDFFLKERNNKSEQIKKDLAKFEIELKECSGDAETKSEIKYKIAQLKSPELPFWLFVTNDTNAEALGQAFKYNYRGVFLVKDELEGLLASLHKQGFEVLRPLLNEAWNGAKPHRVIRIGRGITDIPSVTLSILGGIQPDVLAANFRDEMQKGMGSDGMLARFQLCSIYGSVDVKESDADIDMAIENRQINGLIYALHEHTKNFNLSGLPPAEPLHLSGDAGFIFSNYQKRLHQIAISSDNTNQAFVSHIGKFGRLVLSLSAQFHIVDSVFRSVAIEKTVDKKWVLLAIEWANYMEKQARTMYFSISKSKSTSTLIERIKNGDITDRTSVRQIYRKGWSGLQTPDDVLSALESVSDSNWLKVITESPKGGGRKTEIVRLNPKIIEYVKLNKFNQGGADITDERGDA